MMSLKPLLYENLLVIHLTCDISKNLGTRNLGESCFCWAPQRLANVADGVTQFEGQTVKNSRFFVDFSLCYWEFSQQKTVGFLLIQRLRRLGHFRGKSNRRPRRFSLPCVGRGYRFKSQHFKRHFPDA